MELVVGTVRKNRHQANSFCRLLHRLRPHFPRVVSGIWRPGQPEFEEGKHRVSLAHPAGDQRRAGWTFGPRAHVSVPSEYIETGWRHAVRRHVSRRSPDPGKRYLAIVESVARRTLL